MKPPLPLEHPVEQRPLFGRTQVGLQLQRSAGGERHEVHSAPSKVLDLGGEQRDP